DRAGRRCRRDPAPAQTAGRAPRDHAQVLRRRPRGLHHGGALRRRHAGRDLPDDGEGRLDDIRPHGRLRDRDLADPPVRRAPRGARREVQPHALRARGLYEESRDSDREEPRRLPLPLARLEVPHGGSQGEGWCHLARGARSAVDADEVQGLGVADARRRGCGRSHRSHVPGVCEREGGSAGVRRGIGRTAGDRVRGSGRVAREQARVREQLRRAELPRVRQHHGARRRLLQVPELRGDERLQLRRRRAGIETGLALFVFLQTLAALVRSDRLEVLLWWTRETWLLLTLLWAKNLGIAALAAALVVAVFRFLEAAAGAGPHAARARALVWSAASALVLGTVLRWIWPTILPPAQFSDTFTELEPVLRDPLGASWIGTTPWPGTSHEQISNLYARVAHASVVAFGGGVEGLLSVAAVPGTLLLPAVLWLGLEVGGPAVGVLAVWGVVRFASVAADRRLIATTALAGAIALAPFAWGFVQEPSRLGGHLRDVHLQKPVRDVSAPSGAEATGLARRLAYNALNYTALFTGAADPNARHGMKAHSRLPLFVGLAALLGAAAAFRSGAPTGERALLVFAGGSFLAGILSDPGGAPNSFRVCALVSPLLVWAAMTLRAASVRVAGLV